MIQDIVYRRLSEVSYEEKVKMAEYKIYMVGGNQTWKVIDEIENKDTGVDAKIFKNGDNIIIGFRGTEGNKILGRGFPDVIADAEHIVAKIPVNLYENQFSQALELTKKVKAKYPNSNISVTGHSLGGALGSYVAAKEGLTAGTYSAPSVIDLLPKDLKKKSENGDFDKQIVNYVHPQDSVGAGSIGEYKRHIGSTFYIGSSFNVANAETISSLTLHPLTRFIESLPPTGYHGLDQFKFDKFRNLSHPVLTNAYTRQELWYSPRFVRDTNIELNRDDLITIAEELKRQMAEMESFHIKGKLLGYNHIPKSAYIENDLFFSLQSFHSWYVSRIGEAEYNLRFTAENMRKADTLA